MEKTLDCKLRNIHADPLQSREFLIADAKDADMGFGVAAPGHVLEGDGRLGRFKTLEEYREQIRQVIRQGIVDIVLMSASTAEILCLQEGLFENSQVTPAMRANDATDIFVFRGSNIPREAARPFRSATIDHTQCGRWECPQEQRKDGVNLGLYSVTFNNDVELDLKTLEAYKEFRLEAEAKGFRHFLEVFHPNLQGVVEPRIIPNFINDVIARTLAGVTSSARPLFLKIPYPGPAALEELVSYDPHLVVGILGGSAGTTRDAFQMIHDAQKYGARVALYGRKINNAENQLAFIEFLRLIVDGVVTPEEAVRAYHAVLVKLGLPARRPLEEDQKLTEQTMSYSSTTGKTLSIPSPIGEPKIVSDVPDQSGATQSVSSMNSEERLAYFRERLRKLN
ncbi:MAG: hypothetical protein KDA80_06530 [Planctomycetaceae bacterium]|nr:hypothetical protein [Planctomycetaceae bacterium]